MDWNKFELIHVSWLTENWHTTRHSYANSLDDKFNEIPVQSITVRSVADSFILLHLSGTPSSSLAN